MRTLMKFQVPVEIGNQAPEVLEHTLRDAMASLDPESAYFYSENGTRSGFFVFDLAALSDLVLISETFFRRLNAKVEFFPVLNADDLRDGLKKIQAKL
jgi:hypothetical protein